MASGRLAIVIVAKNRYTFPVRGNRFFIADQPNNGQLAIFTAQEMSERTHVMGGSLDTSMNDLSAATVPGLDDVVKLEAKIGKYLEDQREFYAQFFAILQPIFFDNKHFLPVTAN